MGKVKDFFKRKNITFSPKKYFVDAMGAMALGLFSTLLIGTILNTLGTQLNVPFLCDVATRYVMPATGVVLGIAVAYKLDAPPLVLFSAGVVGKIGYDLKYGDMQVTAGPAGAFLCALIAVEIGKIVSKETPVDILVTPLITIFAGLGAAYLLCYPIAFLMDVIGKFVNTATELYPVLMGAIVGLVVGIVLTLPISSAALCAMIGITGVAGGAAAAGCCAQMVGFAVISFKENKWGGLVSQGLGTSMLQMGNIVKNPRVWIPPCVASAICGSLSAALFSLPCTGTAAGMGTCGLVGVLGIVSDLLALESVAWYQWLGLPLVTVVLPATISLLVALPMRKKGWIKNGDMKLEL